MQHHNYKSADDAAHRPFWGRINRIHEMLKEGKYPTCAAIAQAMAVSPKTTYRDLDFMRYTLNMPIEFDNVRKGFYYTSPVEHLPGMPMTEAEIFALYVAHKAIEKYQGTPFQKPLQTAFRKLTGQLDGQERYSLGALGGSLSFRPLAPEDADQRAFQTITRALEERRVLTFQYRNLGARELRDRRGHPYHLTCCDNNWYLLAFDLHRSAIRTFSLSRIQHARLTQETYTVPADFDADEYLRGSFTIFKGHDDYEVVLEFDPWGTDLVRGRQWHPSQEFTEVAGGFSRMRLRLNNIEEILGWVLSLGPHATVIRPTALAQRIHAIAQELSRRYAPPAEN